jgi:hypothetical protein
MAADESESKPMVAEGLVVPEESGRTVDLGDDDVEIAAEDHRHIEGVARTQQHHVDDQRGVDHLLFCIGHRLFTMGTIPRCRPTIEALDEEAGLLLQHAL